MRYREVIAAGAILLGTLPASASASHLQTLYSFTGGADGGQPGGQLLPGAGLSFYGTTQSGGAGSAGTVFRIQPAGNGSWNLTTLYSFAGGNDGAAPTNMISDWFGNFYGVTTLGGGGTYCAGGCGTVFELSPAGNGTWTEKVLHAFDGTTDGLMPNGLAWDAAGNLIGFALLGGPGECRYLGGFIRCGTVFELSPPAHSGQPWAFTLLYAFKSDRDGAGPLGPLVFGKNGSVYGMTAAGGIGHPKVCGPQVGCGFVFELKPRSDGKTPWIKHIIYQFHGPDGNGGYGPVTTDSQGNLYGMTNEGGPVNPLCREVHKAGIPAGCGVAFKLTPPASGEGMWSYQKIWNFQYGADGAYPQDSPLIWDHGALFGTSSGPPGAVVEFIPPQQGQSSWTENTLFAFSNDANGAQPITGLTLRGALYGTTEGLGKSGSWGTVFRITP